MLWCDTKDKALIPVYKYTRILIPVKKQIMKYNILRYNPRLSMIFEDIIKLIWDAFIIYSNKAHLA